MGRFRLKGRIRMSGGKKSRRTMLMAALTAGALALGYLAPAAFAEGGGGGSGEGGGGSGGQVPSQTADAHWIYKDSWPATLEGMKQAIRDSVTTLSSDLEDGSNQFVDMNAILAEWSLSATRASATACSAVPMSVRTRVSVGSPNGPPKGAAPTSTKASRTRPAPRGPIGLACVRWIAWCRIPSTPIPMPRSVWSCWPRTSRPSIIR